MNKRWPHSGKYKYNVVRRLKRSEPEPESVDDIVQFFREKQKGESKMRKFWGWVKQVVSVQGLVTLGFTGVTIYLYATGQPIPESLLGFDGLVLGYFFGANINRAKR